ncbi:alpha-amylase [Cytophagales bacterium WSM2-2]|nr:alpha-amylase [Cytophagales bacterium WSM2-2]
MLRTFKTILIVFLAIQIRTSLAQNTAGTNEVIYHIFLRSFYDSNGDDHGDLKGLEEKLDYLQDLGVTSILLTPINSSVYYHNYFSDDFEKIDQEYGTMPDYISLARNVHRRGMKIYLDMETQYVTEDHLWWKDSYGNLKSPYSEFPLYEDAKHLELSTIIYGLTGLTGYDNVHRKITTVNLRSKKVLDYNVKLFRLFIDPNKDGKFDDGADGFRLDHAMDSLDMKPQLTGLFENFWKPLITQIKETNPDLTIMAEQANWANYGTDYLTKANVDLVFAFNILGGIASFDKERITKAIDATLAHTPAGKRQIVFIENHDVQRFATTVNKDIRKLKLGAAMNLCLGQVPSIYYGQELGMTGAHREFNRTDGNDILLREAFEWNKSDEGKGMALWYKNTGPWWNESNLKADDGVSLEEEKADAKSLYNYYKWLLNLRKNNSALHSGAYQVVENYNENVFSFLRRDGKQTFLVVVNLSDSNQKIDLALGKLDISRVYFVSPGGKPTGLGPNVLVALQPYDVHIWKCE